MAPTALVVAAGALALATPFLLVALAGCFSFQDSCGDGVGWGRLISAQVSSP